MPNIQYHLYSVDTGHFYSSREKYFFDMYCKYRRECKAMQDTFTGQELKRLYAHKRGKARQARQRLATLLSNKTRQNEISEGRDHIRTLREERIHDTNIISAFSSSLSRAIGIKQDELTGDLIIVQIYHFEIFKDISFYGFTFRKEQYRYFTSSAGQIRHKKAVFLKETVWNRLMKTILCGLTVDKINARGGNNVNKHLAYMALTCTATEEWDGFDIDRAIVINDFETDVYGTFDYVDETDYTVTRKTGFVPVPHTDGAGMILPSVSAKNFMFRAPWIKGLLGVFDFRKFVEANGCSPVITDIYGKEHDIIREDIQIIFTKSQFKMHKYYDSWEEYRECFKKYHCRAGRCNMEEDRIKNARLNYQMLQTLTDISDDELDLLTHRSSERIRKLCSSKDTMLEALGITAYNSDMNPFQKAVKIYPALLKDSFTKDLLRDIKNSLVRKYRSGKLEVTGKYTFLLPDFYAACEYWFGHIENPTGLLKDQEVYCRLYRQYDRLDCLRSPHLYREHAIRINTAGPACSRRADEIGKWFPTNALYTSPHDLISKLLQFDVDGDKSLVVADPDFIRLAERNMKDIVPLYYNMRKAEPTQLNARTIHAGLKQAFACGNIGKYSNDISKIWNHDCFINGSEQEKKEAVDVIKLLCMENNFCIDAAKTLYMPRRPEWFRTLVSKYTRCRLPAFFEHAKDKEASQLAERNQSTVNRIYSRIPNTPVSTRGTDLESIDYRKMMRDSTIICSRETARLYDSLNRQYRYSMNIREEYTDNLHYIACKLRAEFARTGYPEPVITDMLVEYLYGRNKRYKQLLWLCYGQYIVNNLERNVGLPGTKCIQCRDCGEWIEISRTDRRTCRCGSCRELYRREYEKNKKRQQRNK